MKTRDVGSNLTGAAGFSHYQLGMLIERTNGGLFCNSRLMVLHPNVPFLMPSLYTYISVFREAICILIKFLEKNMAYSLAIISERNLPVCQNFAYRTGNLSLHSVISGKL